MLKQILTAGVLTAAVATSSVALAADNNVSLSVFAKSSVPIVNQIATVAVIYEQQGHHTAVAWVPKLHINDASSQQIELTNPELINGAVQARVCYMLSPSSAAVAHAASDLQSCESLGMKSAGKNQSGTGAGLQNISTYNGRSDLVVAVKQ